MQKRKLAIFASSGGLVLAAVTGAVIATNDHGATPAKPVAATAPSGITAASVQAASSVKRVSFKCGRARMNLSYKVGDLTTTFYFNNHCSQHRHVQWWLTNWPGKHTFVVNPHTKGSKRYSNDNSHLVVKIT